MQALWMVLAAFLFATMAVCVKFASAWFNSFELVFYRGVVGMVFMAFWARTSGVSLKTPVPGMHVWRTLIGTFSMTTWFYALAHLPVPTAMTLNYMSGIWLAAFVMGGAIYYGHIRNQGPLLATIMVSFAGVVLVLHPTIEQNQLFAGIIGLLSGVTAALAYMQVKALGQTGEPETRTVFYFATGTMVAGFAGMLVSGISVVPWPQWLWVVPLGILASLGQWCMTRAFAKGATLLVANLQYAGIIFASLYSLVLFGDPIDALEWLGIGLIVGSGILSAVLRAKLMPPTNHEEPEER